MVLVGHTHSPSDYDRSSTPQRNLTYFELSDLLSLRSRMHHFSMLLVTKRDEMLHQLAEVADSINRAKGSRHMFVCTCGHPQFPHLEDLANKHSSNASTWPSFTPSPSPARPSHEHPSINQPMRKKPHLKLDPSFIAPGMSRNVLVGSPSRAGGVPLGPVIVDFFGSSQGASSVYSDRSGVPCLSASSSAPSSPSAESVTSSGTSMGWRDEESEVGCWSVGASLVVPPLPAKSLRAVKSGASIGAIGSSRRTCRLFGGDEDDGSACSREQKQYSPFGNTSGFLCAAFDAFREEMRRAGVASNVSVEIVSGEY
ncbi:hypothetical protein HDU98_003051 [Podochytrium sp. JEL0797]|nr:hypothetical protein HDU98_003051 [Podochytrium sp. JEL0797]